MKDILRGTFFINGIECYMDVTRIMLMGIRIGEDKELYRDYNIVTFPILEDNEDDIIRDLNKILTTSESNLAFEVVDMDNFRYNKYKEDIKNKTFDNLNKMLIENNRKINIESIKDIL